MRKFSLWLIVYCVLQLAVIAPVYSAVTVSPVDRMQLVAKQILLLKNRYAQVENEWHTLKAQQDTQVSRLVLEKTSKKL